MSIPSLSYTDYISYINLLAAVFQIEIDDLPQEALQYMTNRQSEDEMALTKVNF